MGNSPSDAAGRPPSLRVAHVIETLGMGGAENLAVRTTGELAARGHEAHLVVITEPGPLSAEVHPRVHVHYLRFWRASVRNPFAFVGSLWRGRRLLDELLARHRIELLQTHLPGANFWGLLLARRGRRRVFFTVHNNEEFSYGEINSPLMQWLRKRAYKQLLRRSAGAIAVSPEVKTSLSAMLGVGPRLAAKIHVIRNGVRIHEPLAADRRSAVRAGLGIGPREVLVLAAGRFTAQKNFQDLVGAGALLQAAGSPVRLMICGEGELSAQVARQVADAGLQDRILLPGNVLNLGEVMAAADLFAISSLWEGLPLVLLEAMAAGLPIVGYDIAGVREVIRDGVEGRLVPAGDVRALAAGLAELAADAPRRQVAGAAAREAVRRDYDFADTVSRLVDLYRSV